MSDERHTAWDNPTWVRAVMHYPDDAVLLDRLSAGAEITFRPQIERELQDAAMLEGKAAGNVLMALYAITQAHWRLPCAPSLAVAYHCAEQLELADRAAGAEARRRGESPPDRRGPQGHTKIEEAYNRLRSVAHLWAGARFYWEFSGRRRMPETQQDLRALLGISRAIQKWACDWRPPRTRQYKPLLGDKPWLIPADIPALAPPWGPEPPPLLRQALEAYRRRSRG